jgi:hypothetical protein
MRSYGQRTGESGVTIDATRAAAMGAAVGMVGIVAADHAGAGAQVVVGREAKGESVGSVQ